jgi:hypothetical protein
MAAWRRSDSADGMGSTVPQCTASRSLICRAAAEQSAAMRPVQIGNALVVLTSSITV